jgi:hypothetical protein
MIGVLLVRKSCRALGNGPTDIVVVVAVVNVLIGMFNVFLSITTISWHLNRDNFQFSFHKIGLNQGPLMNIRVSQTVIR